MPCPATGQTRDSPRMVMTNGVPMMVVGTTSCPPVWCDSTGTLLHCCEIASAFEAKLCTREVLLPRQTWCHTNICTHIDSKSFVTLVVARRPHSRNIVFHRRHKENSIWAKGQRTSRVHLHWGFHRHLHVVVLPHFVRLVGDQWGIKYWLRRACMHY